MSDFPRYLTHWRESDIEVWSDVTSAVKAANALQLKALKALVDEALQKAESEKPQDGAPLPFSYSMLPEKVLRPKWNALRYIQFDTLEKSKGGRPPSVVLMPDLPVPTGTRQQIKHEPIQDARCNPNGFNIKCLEPLNSQDYRVERMMGWVGLFMMLDGASHEMIREFTGVKHKYQLQRIVDWLGLNVGVEICEKGTCYHIVNMGPIMKPDRLRYFESAFPLGKLRLRGELFLVPKAEHAH